MDKEVKVELGNMIIEFDKNTGGYVALRDGVRLLFHHSLTELIKIMSKIKNK